MLRTTLIALFFLFTGLFPSYAQEIAKALSALEDARQTGDSTAIGEAHHKLGYQYLAQNRYPEALEHLLIYERLLDPATQGEKLALTHLYLGDIYGRTGRFDEALTAFGKSTTYYQEQQEGNMVGKLAGKKAFVHINKGEFTVADSLLQSGIAQILGATPTDSSTLADVSITTGILYSRQSRFEEALTFYQQAEKLYESLGSRKRLRFVYNNVSGAYLANGNTPKALDYLQKSVRLSEEFDLQSGVGGGLNNIAMVHLMQEDYQQAIEYSQRSLAVAYDIQDSALIARAYNTISEAYRELGQLDSSLQFGLRSLVIRESIGDKPGVASSRLRIGTLYLAQGDYELARSNLDQSLVIWEQVGERKGKTESNLALGELAIAQQQYRRAVSLCKQAYTWSVENDFAEEKEGSCRCLAKAYENLGDLASALRFQKAYQSARDSLLNRKRIQQITRMEMQYDFDEEKQTIAREQEQKDAAFERRLFRQRLIGWSAIAGLAAGLIILALLWRSYRIKQRANRQLTAQKATIQRSLEEREVLLKEIHHRVKNNLQVVSSLLGLQSRSIEDPVALDAIEEGRNRVRAMALIHQNLYQEENLVGVDLPDYIDKLSENLLSSYQVDETQIRLKRNIAPISLDVDVLIPLGLILNELISNSLKHAFTGREEGEIAISVQPSDAELEVIVSDNGRGLPQNFQPEQVQSLGFKLIGSFVKKMKGKLEVVSYEGTRIRMLIPHA